MHLLCKSLLQVVLICKGLDKDEDQDKDDHEILNILNGFLNALGETSVNLQEHRNRVDTLINQKTNVTVTENRFPAFFAQKPF